jgi:hypoxanthine phosphoribosyltransferase
MDTIHLLDKRFAMSISGEEIQGAVDRIAGRLNNDLQGEEPVFLGILNGVFMFAADLLKRITLPAVVSFIKLSSYSGTRSGGRVKELIGINEDLQGRTVVILEDIVDTGTTLAAIIELLEPYRPKTVKIVTLFLKTGKYRQSIRLDYVGMEIPDEFIIGYGLDYNGYGRNHPFVSTLCDE